MEFKRLQALRPWSVATAGRLLQHFFVGELTNMAEGNEMM